jgi:hypothetical protein
MIKEAGQIMVFDIIDEIVAEFIPKFPFNCVI